METNLPENDTLIQKLQSSGTEVIDISNVVATQKFTEPIFPTGLDISYNTVQSYNEGGENIFGKTTIIYNEIGACDSVKVDSLSSLLPHNRMFMSKDDSNDWRKKWQAANSNIYSTDLSENNSSKQNVQHTQFIQKDDIKPFNDIQPFNYLYEDDIIDSRKELMAPFNKIKVQRIFDENRTYLLFNDGFRSNLKICVFKTKYGKHVYANNIVIPYDVFLSISHCSVEKLPKGTTENLEHLDFTTDLNRIKCETYSGETFIIPNTTVPHIMAAIQELNESEKYEISHNFLNMLPTNIKILYVICYVYLVAMFSRLCPTRR